MRQFLIGCALLAASACAPSAFAPSSVENKITGTWTGNFASANNDTVPIQVFLYQNGSSVSGTWRSSGVYEWSGALIGSADESSFTGKLSFTGRTAENTLCPGSAQVSGSVSQKSLSLTSADGVTGPPCSAPLPVDIEIDLHR